MSARIPIAKPVIRWFDDNWASSLHIVDLSQQPLDYGLLEAWLGKLKQLPNPMLIAKQDGHTIVFDVGQFGLSKYHSTQHDRHGYLYRGDDACLSMMGIRYGDGQPVCISLSIAHANGSYIPVAQSVAI